jgi:hypothetical protein
LLPPLGAALQEMFGDLGHRLVLPLPARRLTEDH